VVEELFDMYTIKSAGAGNFGGVGTAKDIFPEFPQIFPKNFHATYFPDTNFM